MVTRRQIVAGLQDDQPTVLMGDVADHAAKRFHVSRWASPEDSCNWEVEVSKAGAFAVTALVRGAGYQGGGIGEASLEPMKALKAEMGV